MSIPQDKLTLVPLTLHEANALIVQWHRHHGPVRGCHFCLGAALGDQIVGVAVVGRPVARLLDNGLTAEVTRLCSDGTPHCGSFLLSAAKRAAYFLGYRRLITYTLTEEGGASLRAADWHIVDTGAGGGSWDRQSRPRVDTHPLQTKLRWEAPL